MAILWSVDPETYRRVIYILGVPPVMVRGAWYGHNPLPFVDLAGVLSWAQCHAQGIDVFVRNPCDPMARLFNYGPGSLLPFGSPDDTLAAGAVLDSVFLLMVALILRPATGGEFAIALLALFSHAVFLAVERANLDIAIFILVMRLVDILYTMPFIFFAILLLAVFGRSLLVVFVALGAVTWLTMARIVRGQVLSLRNAEFVLAARTMGVSHAGIIFRHLIPNTLGPTIVYATLTVPAVMLQEAV